MSRFVDKVRTLVADGKYAVTAHAFFKLDKERIVFADVRGEMANAVVVEEYPEYHKGPSVLVKLNDSGGKPIHALWGLAIGTEEPAYPVTVYRPDAAKWSTDFLQRRSA